MALILKTTRSQARSALGAAALAASLLCAPMASAQIDSREGIALQNQILELKQELAQMQQLQVQANGPQSNLAPPAATDTGTPPQPPGAGGDITAQLLVRVSALEEQVRSIQGRIEELSNNAQRDHDELAKQIGDLTFKLGQGASATAPPPPDAGTVPADDSSAAPPPLRAPPSAPAPRRTAEMALKSGNAALARRDYPAAEAASREVLAMGHGVHTADATFLLARALVGEHQYKPAAASFYAVYKASPRTPRGAEGLLGVANAMVGLGDTRDACEAVAKFNAEFPRPEPGLRQAAVSIRKRASCR